MKPTSPPAADRNALCAPGRGASMGLKAALRRAVQVAVQVAAQVAALALPAAGGPGPFAAAPAPGSPPQHLRDTGLYAADTETARPAGTAAVLAQSPLRAGLIGFTPQYPLWSDGADKRRWLWLPPGARIDASRPDAWVFPRGTRLWKEFGHGGRPVETRFIELGRDGVWRFATYVWTADGSDAVLAPERGIAALPVAAAPEGRYAVPGRDDCRACHESNPVPVIGLAALQLSPAHATGGAAAARSRAGDPIEADLVTLVARGLVRGLPRALLDSPPRIASADAAERAALGYLHGNCGHCHHRGPNRVPLALTLAQRVADPEASLAEVKATTLGAPSGFRLPGGAAVPVALPGRPEHSALVQRMRSRAPQQQMPPLGTRHADAEGLALVERWIAGAADHPRHPPTKESLP